MKVSTQVRVKRQLTKFEILSYAAAMVLTAGPPAIAQPQLESFEVFSANIYHPSICEIAFDRSTFPCDVFAVSEGDVSVNAHFDITYNPQTGDAMGVSFILPFEWMEVSGNTIQGAVVGIVDTTVEPPVLRTDGYGICVGRDRVTSCFFEFDDGRSVEAIAEFRERS